MHMGMVWSVCDIMQATSSLAVDIYKDLFQIKS